MSRYFLPLLFLVLMINTALAQQSSAPVTGDWTGSLNAVSTELPLVFHIKESPDGTLFQTASTGGPAEYDQLEETIAHVALETIAEWMKGVVK